ncbi:hypothetical protein [Nitratireductor luteus]|uniref:hypothetical protein n=1 Tax=Nitratireductor luteus TaxID=2976980 RepID=UPI0022403BAA|nr:hypothetical protein [Nitratireductor luteus]
MFKQAAQRLAVRLEREPIDSLDGLVRFTQTRAAFVSQKKLYGYLKTRMGTRYPSMFEDDVFVESINIAKRHVFAASLSDITVHVSSRVAASGTLQAHARALAIHCHEAGLGENREELGDDLVKQYRETFAARLEHTQWQNLAMGADCFTESPAALYRWAPIEDSLKRYDREIVENSIRFAWSEVIRDFRNRSVPDSIAANFLARTGRRVTG